MGLTRALALALGRHHGDGGGRIWAKAASGLKAATCANPNM